MGYDVFNIGDCYPIRDCNSFKEFFNLINGSNENAIDRFHTKYVKKVMDSAVTRKRFVNMFYQMFKDTNCNIKKLTEDFEVSSNIRFRIREIYNLEFEEKLCDQLYTCI